MIAIDVLQKIKPGAKVRVWEGAATAPFEGVVIARKHGLESGATFTVRTVMAGVGVEKIYPIKTPLISKIDIVSSPKKVRRAKLYWTRKASAAKIRQRIGVSL
jgi:large subunit ribosomal protein L19